MKIYNTYYYDRYDTKVTQPCFTTKEKAKDYFWNMLHDNEDLYDDFKEMFYDNGEEDESFKDFVYAVLNGWDMCGVEENELID